ncbi:MAG: TolC family protein [Deltaproteobacteria bacterium]|nr:TolC family protein [Deltaproteobacteria bacterium]
MLIARFSFFVCILLLFSLMMEPVCLFAEEYSLGDLYRIALERAEKIKLSEENLYISETGGDKAISLLLPKLSAFGSYTKYSEDKYNMTRTLIQPDKASSWGLRADESLSLSGREFTALSIARENIVKSRYDLYAVREEYLFQVANAYYDVLKAKKALDIAEANLERLTKHRNAAQKRLKVGEVTKTVLLRAEGELSGARSDYVKAKNLLELARSLLSRIVGIGENYQLKEASAEEVKILSVSSLNDMALLKRSDLKSLEIQKNIAEKQVRFTQGAYWPSLAISGVYASSDQSPETPNLVKESSYGLLSLNFPFFEGGLRRAEVREAKARERQSSLLYEDYKKSVGIEVQSAYLDIATQKGILKFLEDQLIFARDNYNAVSKQFEFGLANSIDVMDANTLLVSAERQMSEAMYNYQIAVLRMKKATGILLKSVMEGES